MKDSARLIAVVIIIFFLPALLLSLDTFRLVDRVEPHIVASGVASANVTLAQDLYDDDTKHVTSISSNVTTDAAIASTYTPSTNVLLITGLDSTKSHYLTFTYSMDRLEDYVAAKQATLVIPALILLGILVIVAGVGVSAFRKGE